jgi:hypothetical protein
MERGLAHKTIVLCAPDFACHPFSGTLCAFFGEVPLLLGTPYMLSGRAERDCRLIVFPGEAFWKLLRLCPAISGEIFRAMVTRLRNIEGSARQQEKLRSEQCPPALPMN